jgi:hypothetical protein
MISLQSILSYSNISAVRGPEISSSTGIYSSSVSPIITAGRFKCGSEHIMAWTKQMGSHDNRRNYQIVAPLSLNTE